MEGWGGSLLVRPAEVIDGGFSALDQLTGLHALNATWVGALDPLRLVRHRGRRVSLDVFYVNLNALCNWRKGRRWIDF